MAVDRLPTPAEQVVPIILRAHHHPVFRLGRASVGFCFIVKDGAEYLEANLDSLITFARRFAHHDVFVAENDSTDATRSILQRALDAGNITACEMLTLDGVSSLELCADGEEWNCTRRTRRLAYLRDKALALACASPVNYEYLVMLDMDFVSFDPTALFELFLYMRDHPQVNGMFGMSVTEGGGAYDTGALITDDAADFDDVQYFRKRYVPVRSAFSGFGVYRHSELQRVNASYRPETVHEIEHIRFNGQLSHLVVDTNFRPVYERASRNNIRPLMKKVKVWLWWCWLGPLIATLAVLLATAVLRYRRRRRPR